MEKKLHLLLNLNLKNRKCSALIINPFRPTGPFLAPKLIILIKYLIYFLFFKVLF